VDQVVVTNRRPPRRWVGRIGPTVVLVACGLFFVLPLLTMARYSFQNVPTILLTWSNVFKKWSFASLQTAFKDPRFWPTLWLSLRLALGTVLLTQALLIPTALLVHLKVPKARPIVEFLTLLPYMVPPIALVAGVAAFFRPNAKWFLNSDFSLIPFYAVLALPFTYRALDAGIRAIDVRTLIDASKSLGAGWGRTLWRVLLPNMRPAIVASTVLTATVVLGEFTIAHTLLKNTFQTFLGEYFIEQGQAGTALAFLYIVGTTLLLVLLMFATRRRGDRSAPTVF
jgi:putative spermidine/putrescine transport system permease protein